MIDTVRAHLEGGVIEPRSTGMTADDLEMAATWLEAFEAATEPDDDTWDEGNIDQLVGLATVAAWCRREAGRRRKAQLRRAARRQWRERTARQGG